MMASLPHVTAPPICQVTIGKQPCEVRTSAAGRSAPRHTSSMPPVPKVALASPGRVHDWPTSEACWSPTSAARGSPPSAETSPRSPEESTMAGSHAGSMPSRSRASARHVPDAALYSPVTPALVASVMCRAPPVRFHAIQLSTVPRRRSAPAPAPTCSTCQANLVADSLGEKRRPAPCISRHLPTVRRSCHPRPGPSGRPVRASHATVDARWVVMPIAAGREPAAARVSAATSRAAVAMDAGSNSTSPGKGTWAGVARRRTCSTEPSGSTWAARTLDVPTSMTRIPLTARHRRARTGRPARASPG